MAASTTLTRPRRPRRQHYHPVRIKARRLDRSITTPCLDHLPRGSEIDAMLFDEMDRLAECRPLFDLLLHYALRGCDEREVWQDRVAEAEGIDSRQLIKLHGELLAYGWIEQNTGMTPVLKHGLAPLCYRVTATGLRAWKQAKSEKMHAA
jgi:hypothetical protein